MFYFDVYYWAGNRDADQVLTVLLSTGMLVGGVIGCVLDNLLPGLSTVYYLIKVFAMCSQLKSEHHNHGRRRQFVLPNSLYLLKA